MMERRFEKELESLKTSLIKMGSAVEDGISLSLQALLQDDEPMARKVIESDERVDSLEIEIDNAVIDILALKQPVASDLRLIVAVQKINNDLERIGDHAVNIAESVVGLKETAVMEPLLELPRMADLTRSMLRDALDSFILVNPELARSVLERDDQIDELNRNMNRAVIESTKSGKITIESGLHLIRISRNLERVADLATNIAEEVIFLTQARVVKHHAEERSRSTS
jgi:phosphate transport system protein